MKVLSLTEPYAKYRGELYIHASATKISKEWKDNKELMKLVDNTSLN